MPNRLQPSFALLLLLLLVSGFALARGGVGPAYAPAGPVLAQACAEDPDPAHDERDHASAEHGDHDEHDDHADHDDHGDHGDHDDNGDHDHAHGVEGARLLVASLDGPELAVLDAETGAILGRFTVPGPGRVHQLPNAQLAAVVHGDADRVSFVHSGLNVVDHGDHADLLEGPPYVLATVNLGRGPDALFAAGHDVAVALAEQGTVAWLDARLLGVSLDFVEVAGVAGDALAVVDGHLLVATAAEAAVRVFDRGGAPVATFGGCPAPGAQVVLGATAAFGCADGVLLVSSVGGVFVAHKVAYPAGRAPDARVTTLAGAEGVPFLAGDFGQGIALIDPVARSLAPVALPAQPVDLRLAEDGGVLLVLTLDGVLHAVDPVTGAVEASVAAVHPMQPGRATGSLATMGGLLVVTDPAHREIVAVDVEHLEVEARWPLPFAPGSVAVMAIEGAVRH